MIRSIRLAVMFCVVWPAGLAAAIPTDADRHFARRVLPVLNEKCLACHGGRDTKGKFRITDRAATLAGGESGEPAVLPGDPQGSLLLAAIRWDGLEMPPKENDRLSDKQIEAVRQWIADGAVWPNAAILATISAEKDGDADGGVTVATSGGLSADWTNRRYDPAALWAYQPLANPPVPDAPGPRANWIDAFINAGLAEAGLEPAPPADRRTLLRRVTFDLTGLPPTPRDVAAFLSDPAPEEVAFGKVIDHLLASPHYGEHWGRHWLDVTRYADSGGFSNDYDRGNAWRYRDYVVRAFNDDLPYAAFIRDQIAGDELRSNDPEGLVAVGFLRMGPWELSGMEVPKVARQRFLDDVTDAVGQVFLSTPLQCAKCHDHKFDPIPTRDYYRVHAAFATTQLAERDAAFLADENTGGFDERKYLDARGRWYEETLKEVGGKNKADRTPREFGLQRVSRKGKERLQWEALRYEPTALSVYAGLTPKLKAVYSPLRMPDDPMTKGEQEATAILGGGDAFSPTVPVSPGALSVVNTFCGTAVPSDTLTDEITGRRAALANWVASSGNALAARSIVNRVWGWHFGRGIVTSANNFGATGSRPTHPELLDRLAADFLAGGGSIKWLHRLILNSEAYRRASRHPDPEAAAVRDPTGGLLAAFPPRRLTAEELRDTMLAVSGEINPAVGGIPVRPEINPEVAFQPRMVMGTFAAAWQANPNPADRHRRSVYALVLRGLRDPQMETFNQPGPDLPCESRDASTITPQVFALFNGTATHARALALAARLMETQPDEAHPPRGMGRDTVIDRAFRLTFNRPPTVAERAACLAHWSRAEVTHAAVPPPPSVVPTQIVREAVEENTGTTFTYTEPLPALADFVPDLQPHQTDAATRGLADVCLVLLNANEFAYVD